MPYARARTIFEVDAIVHLGLGALLLLGSWNGLYHGLDLPRVNPALLGQVGGAAFVGFAWLLWMTPSVPELARQVAGGAAVANAIAGLVVVGWLVGRWGNLTNYWHVGALGKAILIGMALGLLALAAIERHAYKHGIVGLVDEAVEEPVVEPVAEPVSEVPPRKPAEELEQRPARSA